MNGRLYLSRGRITLVAHTIAVLVLALVPLTTEAAPVQREGQWWTEFFGNTTLSGSPLLTRFDTTINFDWGAGSPGAGVPADNFSARWTRTEWFDSGTYRFFARSDDGFRLWVGDMLVIDAWHDRQAAWMTRDLYVGQGTYQVRAEYYEHTGGAAVGLSWERISGGRAWQAEYFSNQDLNGEPSMRRSDSAIDFAWGYDSPHEAVPADHFSVRWTYTLGFTAGTYRFLTSTDDGVRLWIDDHLLVDAWYNQKLPNTHSGDMVLGEGLHQVKVEYFENGGEAHAHVWWQRLDSGYIGWKGEYFDNRELVGGPALVRDDSEIAFDWGTAPPVTWMPDDNFSARWTRRQIFDPGYYTFSVRSDDGVRVWLDGGLVIDKWQVMDNELHYVDGIYLTGAHQLKVEYFEQTGNARIRFWISPSTTPSPATTPDLPPPSPGTVVVDNSDAGFVTGGSPTGWHTAYEGHGGSLIWTRNNDWQRPNYNWARWFPGLVPGYYEVFVFIPERYTTTTNARYQVVHANAFTLRTVNQSIHGNRWVSLGTFWFDGSGKEYVSLSDTTQETWLSRLIAFDAVKWERR